MPLGRLFPEDGFLRRRHRHRTAVPIAEVDRLNGELRFEFRPSPEMELPDVALMAPTDYRIWMPFSVNLEFFFPGGDRSHLWMTASPIGSGVAAVSGVPAALPTRMAMISRISISRTWFWPRICR